MAHATWVQSNFNGGEWSPLAQGRFDLPKYRNSLALCSNFMPTQQGGLTRRPGTPYVARVKDSSYAPRLIPFEFSLTQSYILEFGAGYIRFYVNDGQLQIAGATAPWVTEHLYGEGAIVSYGASVYRAMATHISGDFAQALADQVWVVIGSVLVPYEVATNYSIQDVWELDFAQKFDTLYLTHPNHPTAKLQRAGATNWVVSNVSFLDGPYLRTNTTSTTLTPSGTAGTVTVTASSVNGINNGFGFLASDVGRALRVKCGGVWVWGLISAVTDTTHVQWAINSPNGSQTPKAAVATANVSGGSVFSITVLDGGNGYGVQPPNVVIVPHLTDPATATLTTSGGVITAITLTHAGSGYSTFFPLNPIGLVALSFTGGTGAQAYALIGAGGSVVSITLVNGGSGYANSDTVSFLGGASAGSGAVAYATISEGVVIGVTVSVTGSGYTNGADVFLAAPAGILVSSTTFWRLGEWNAVDGYPAHAVFHADRLYLSGNSDNPSRADGSNVGDYENFAPTGIDGTVVDSNAVAFTLASGSIQWLVSDKQGLLCGADSGEWVIAPSGTQQAITPTNVNVKPLGNFGAINVRPLRIGGVTLYIQRTSRKLREVLYQFAYDTFTNVDISLVAEHLTKGGIKQMAAQFAPYQIVWIVRNDGTLVGMTYDRDQEVNGWHRHQLGGYSDAAQTLPPLVESVACIPAPDTRRDEVWLVVKRYINGAFVRTIERMARVWEDGDDVADAFYLDCGATYIGAATQTITGLTWLVGQTVGVLADGGFHADCVVNGAGVITLSRPASKVQVGLGNVSQGKTLRVEAGGADGPSQGKLKRIIWTVFRFFQASRFELWSETPGVGFESKAFRDNNDPMTSPVILFSGDKRWTYDGTYASDGQIYFQASGPLPCNITLLMAQVDTREMQ